MSMRRLQLLGLNRPDPSETTIEDENNPIVYRDVPYELPLATTMTWVPQGYALIAPWLTALSIARDQPVGGWMYEV